MAASTTTSPIAIRSYGADSTVDRHDFAQIVLPLAGSLAMDIAGREATIDRATAAYVEAGARHDQVSRAANRSIVLDLHAGDLDDRTAERLARRPYIPLAPEAGGLVDYMARLAGRGPVPAHRLRLWTALLVDALLGDEPQPRSRLAPLLAAVESRLAHGWTVEAMARTVGIGPSRLHAIFQAELGSTPRAWLSARRLERARHLLAHTALPIAELACRCGYADQSALTRAMRQATGTTPAAWRRRAGARD
ncbi:AraC family transcriptional regulator [Luteimonas sp. Y-2-2-4F]|nr:AraC family transcriptional regulator [Luteimonas sp. Y-2-2-4F]MCD9032179.1 AraC family transcriptional regulator [Luteimonas sp. Y-2-2-4F]